MSLFDVDGLTGRILFWGVTLVAGYFFVRRIRQLISYMLLGRKEESFSKVVSRAVSTLLIIVGQWCQFKNMTARDRAAIGHAFMAWGFFAFSMFYFIFIILGAGFGLSESLEGTKFFFYYAWVTDIMAVLVIIGAAWALIRRFVIRPPRLQGEQTFEALVIILSVMVHPITHLGKEATSIALGHHPVGLGSPLPPVSNALSALFTGSAANIEAANTVFFWSHWLVVLFVLVYIAYSRYLHMVASFFNIFFRSPLPVGVLRTIDLEKAESFGSSKITDFTWKQNLDLYACVVCGNCQERCPARASGKTLNPKMLIQDLKKHLLTVGPELVKAKAASSAAAESAPAAPPPAEGSQQYLAGSVIKEDDIWACTTCRACDVTCPLWVDHIDKVVDMRRNLVMERSQMPDPVQQALQCLATREHPWRGTTAGRTDWTKGLNIKTLADDSNVEILYWVGCTAALEERNMKVAQAMAKIMQAAGVKFGILGGQEACCGDPARRLGDEYQFQTLCQKNIETMKAYNVKKIVTACPHCFNTLKNEYPQFGGNYEVIHHSQFILDLISRGKIKVGALKDSKVVTYHDSCYLGRYNGIYDQPRQILKSIGGLKRVEMERTKSNAFCCGGGGGHMWMEEEPDKRVNIKRTEQAIASKAGIVATACPYCLAMFEDGLKTKGAAEAVQARDLSELVLQAMDIEKP